MNIKEARIRAGFTQATMAKAFEIPKRTLESWEMGERKCPDYVKKLIIEKLEGIAMMNAKKVLEKALEINQLQNYIPNVEVGEVIELNDVWDGNGNVPDESYCYKLADGNVIDEEGNEYYDPYINYKFEIIEEKENPLDTLIKVIDIEFV